MDHPVKEVSGVLHHGKVHFQFDLNGTAVDIVRISTAVG